MIFKKVSNKELVEFIRIFNLLLYSKVGITDSLELILKKTGNEYLQQMLKAIIKDLKAGVSLSKSFSKYPGYFSNIFIANLKVAEETGQIAEVVGDYSNYLEKIQNLKRKIAQAVRYPVFVLLIAVGVVFFMLFYIIPTFQSLFTSVKTKLPDLTQFLMDVSIFCVKNNLIILLLAMMVGIMIYSISKSKRLKYDILEKVVWRLPLISTLYLNNLLARFSLSMAILLKSKVGLIDALKISKNVTDNQSFQNQIDKITRKIVKGESFSSNLENSKYFDFTFTRLLAAGEESAELDKVFYIISDYYSKQFDYYLESATSLLEPALILFIGIIVAVILIGLYLPMFDIINYFGV
jgi:type II secretory pathway component PulF